MNKINDLGCSGRLEQPTEARNTAEATDALPETEHLAAFARRLGVNRSTVTRAAQAGRLVLADDGQVRVAQSLTRWHATRGARHDMADMHAAARGHAVAEHVAASAGAATGLAGLQAASVAAGGVAGARQASEGFYGPELPPSAGSAGGLRAAAESERLRWQNALLGLALELTRGTRIPRAAVLREAQGLGNALRAALERLIDQTAPRLAATADPAQQRRLLQAEVVAVRRQMVGEFARAMRRLRPDGSASVLASAAAVSELQDAEVCA